MTSTHQQSPPRISAKNPKFATILVGLAQDCFVVHEEFLTFYSEFFRAALTGDFSEANNKTVKLPDEGNASTFEFFVHWLYYQRFPDAAQGDAKDFVVRWRDTVNEDEVEHLIELYLFGDKYVVPKLQQDTINSIFEILYNTEAGLPSLVMLIRVFEHLPDSDPLCRLLIDLKCFFNSPRSYEEEDRAEWEWPTRYLYGIVRRYGEIFKDCNAGRLVASYDLHVCDYHNHDSDEEKAACRAVRHQKK